MLNYSVLKLISTLNLSDFSFQPMVLTMVFFPARLKSHPLSEISPPHGTP